MCNTGISLIPRVHDNVHRFALAGLHKGLALMTDRETGSYWDHVTGECVHGPLRGYQLEGATPLEYPLAAQLARVEPEARVALSRHGPLRRGITRFLQRSMSPGTKGMVPPHFISTMAGEDTRLPRLELGLGVSIGERARFYPLSVLRRVSEPRLDELAGRRLLIYVDPQTGAPSAVFTDARAAEYRGRELWIESPSGASVIEDGRLRIAGSHRTTARAPSRPQQQFTRWYGFAFLFPECEIAGAVSGRHE